MNIKFKSLVAAAAFIATQAAIAAPVVLTPGGTPYKGLNVSGRQVWTLSNNAITALNAFPAALTPVIPGFVSVATSPTNTTRLTAANVLNPVVSLTVESSTDDIQSVATAGGLTITTTSDSGLTNNGGAVSLTDLEIDLVGKTVYAKVQGNNGVGQLNRFALWQFDAVTGSTKVATLGASAIFTATGLRPTVEATTKLGAALGATDLGVSVLKQIQDYGTLSVTLDSSAAQQACAVSFKTTKTGTRPTYLANQVTVTNLTSSPATGWAVQWAYPSAVIVSGVKNATLSQTASKVFTAKPVKANTTLAAGASTTFSFSTYYAGTAPATTVQSATVAGQACAVTQP
jgi:hypothetical protein